MADINIIRHLLLVDNEDDPFILSKSQSNMSDGLVEVLNSTLGNPESVLPLPLSLVLIILASDVILFFPR